MAVTRRAAIALLAPVAAMAIEPKDKAIAEAAEATRMAERTKAWLQSSDGSGALLYVEKMGYDFDKLLVAEIHRRKKISLRMTTVEENANFKLSGEIKRREDLAETRSREPGWNGPKHFAAVTLVSTKTGEVIWACHEDDRNKFDFNSTGRTFRRVAERCINHLVRKIRGK